ncbi:MAG: sulfotransferase family protein, partial [Pseudomonadota bacterium]
EVVLQRPDHVDIWANATVELPDWHALLGQYQAGVDSPLCFFWRELIVAFPKAKIILTVRDPEDWYDSFEASLYKAMIHPERTPEWMQKAMRMAKSLVLDHFFDGKFQDREYAISVYERHCESVEAFFSDSPDRLLVFNVIEGWQPICEFLNVGLPDAPFPQTNTREEFASLLT